MGVTGLLPFLKKSSDQVNVSQLAGKTVAIDAYVWLHRGAFSCAEKLARGEKTTGYVGYGMKMLNMLIAHKIKPILVFDGRRLKAKEDTEKKRHEARKQNRQKAEELVKAGRAGEARDFMRRSVDVNHLMALELMRAARNINVDCIVAPHEADAQLAYLNRQGIAQVVITEDSDLILFGCTQILYKLDINGNGLLVRADKLHLTLGRPLESPENLLTKLRQICILSGCDYVSSLPGVGLVKAKKFVMACNDPDFLNAIKRMPGYLNLKTKVDDEYIERVAHADLTFRRQLVFDPRTRQQVVIDGDDVESGPYSGNLLEPQDALQLALGNLDPHNMKPVANFSTDNLPTSSIWSGDFLIPKTVYEGPVTAFITSKKETVTQEVVKVKLKPRPRIENRPSSFKLDLELTQLYSDKAKTSASHLQSEVKCVVKSDGEVKEEVRSSYFLTEKKGKDIICVEEEDDFLRQSTPKPTESLLQQIENSPSKRVTSQGPISKNPFAKKTNVPPSPILNRYAIGSTKPEIISPIKTQIEESASQNDSGPLIADSDEGTFRDSLFSQSSVLTDSPQDSDFILAPKPNLSRFKYRRPLFSQSSSSPASTQEIITVPSPEKSPIIKRRRNENMSPTKKTVSKYFNDSVLDSLDSSFAKTPSSDSFSNYTPLRTLPMMASRKSSSVKKQMRTPVSRKSTKVETQQISLFQFGFSKK